MLVLDMRTCLSPLWRALENTRNKGVVIVVAYSINSGILPPKQKYIEANFVSSIMHDG